MLWWAVPSAPVDADPADAADAADAADNAETGATDANSIAIDENRTGRQRQTIRAREERLIVIRTML